MISSGFQLIVIYEFKDNLMGKAAVVAGVIIAAGVVWTGSSWYLGTQIQERFDEYLNKSNSYLEKEGNGKFKLSKVSYEKGLFSSKAAYKLSLNFPDIPKLPKEVIFNSDIEHGPLSLSALKRGEFVTGYASVSTTLANDASLKPLFDAAGGKEPYVQNDRIDFSGNIHSVSTLAALEISRKGTTLKSEPITLNSVIDKEFTSIDMTFNFPGASLISPNKVELVLKDITGQGSSKKSPSGLFVGPASARIGSLNITPEKDVAVAMTDFVVKTNTAEVDKRLNIGVDYDIAKLLINQQDFGAIKLNLAFDSLDPVAVQKFKQQVGTLNLMAKDPQQQEQIEKYYVELVSSLIRGKMKINVAPFTWKTANGEVNVDFASSFDGSQQPAELSVKDNEFLSGSLKNVNLGLKLGEGFIRDVVTAGTLVEGKKTKEEADKVALQSSQMAGVFAQASGMARYESGTVISDISYDASKEPAEQITLNGEKMSVADLTAKAGSMFGGGMPGPATGALEEEEEPMDATEAADEATAAAAAAADEAADAAADTVTAPPAPPVQQ